MHVKTALRPGMRIVGPDDRDYGEIERVDDGAVYVQGRSIPFSAVTHLARDRVYLSPAGLARLPVPSPPETASDDAIRLPLLEERLDVDTRTVDLGEIRVHKTVEETEEVQRSPLSHEVVEVERVRVNRPVSAPEERRQEGDWLIIPIMEEVLVVQKQLMVTEEIRIRKQRVTEEHEVRETVLHERATIEDTRPDAARRP
jgi:uncharacterized protein (TIGR02271 family)